MDVRQELIKLYHEYIADLEKKVDEAVESPDYQRYHTDTEHYLQQLIPYKKERKFGPFKWETWVYPSKRAVEVYTDNILHYEKKKKDIVDKAAPDPSFDNFIQWMIEKDKPKVNQELVKKLRERSPRFTQTADEINDRWAYEHGYV